VSNSSWSKTNNYNEQTCHNNRKGQFYPPGDGHFLHAWRIIPFCLLRFGHAISLPSPAHPAKKLEAVPFLLDTCIPTLLTLALIPTAANQS
jgi:hypothetical protein